jgi:Ca2+-binding EF-hand superfamily protein
MENILKVKLQNNYSNVRKAFLELDSDQDGFITSEDMAKFLKNATAAG